MQNHQTCEKQTSFIRSEQTTAPQQTKTIYTEPEYVGFSNILEYAEDYFNYYLSNQLETDISSTLILVVGIVIFFFLMKNLFNYLALYNITFVKNGKYSKIGWL